MERIKILSQFPPEKLSSLCRICLHSDDNNILFHITAEDTLNSIEDLIGSRLKINTEKDPNKICLKCLEQLQNACKVKQMFIESIEVSNKLIQITAENETFEEAVADYNDGTESEQNDESFDPDDPLLSATKEVSIEKLYQTTIKKTNQQKEKKFACNLCDKSYSINRDLNRHKKTHVDEFICPHCKKVFKFIQSYKSHLQIHERGPEKVPCPVCGQDFKDEKLRNRHMKSSHTNDIYQCEQCFKTFPHISKLTVHMKNHRPDEEKSYQCRFCTKKFNFSHHLKNHEHSHSGDRPFVCKICCASYTQSHFLTIHMRTHTTDKEFKCDACSKVFYTLWRLERHKQSHTRAKTFLCTVCGKQFAMNSSLQRHINLHHKEKPADGAGKEKFCNTCDGKFASQDELSLHSCKHTCEVCKRGFTLQQFLDSHMKSHDNQTNRYICESCGFTYNRAENLKCHIRRVHNNIQPHSCKFCDKSFSQLRELKTHVRKHCGERSFACTFCEKKFPTSNQLNAHKRTHTGKRPYQCEICVKSYKTSATLRSHLLTHEKMDEVKGDNAMIPIEDVSQDADMIIEYIEEDYIDESIIIEELDGDEMMETEGEHIVMDALNEITLGES